MKNLTKVSVLREQLFNKTSRIERKSGIYCWWLKEEAAKILLEKLHLTQGEFDKIQKRELEGENYWALYFGISKDMLARAMWHITQRHSASAVKHGVLSTLRQTFSALLGVDMSVSESKVDDFMNDNCYWEWEYNGNPIERQMEELVAQGCCYPLNIQENKTVSKVIRKELIKLRKQYKK